MIDVNTPTTSAIYADCTAAYIEKIMSKREKLRRKLRNNPKGATMQEVETLLGYFGFRRTRVSGSHHIFESEAYPEKIAFPLHGRKVKAVYVRQVVEIIDAITSEMDGENIDE